MPPKRKGSKTSKAMIKVTSSSDQVKQLESDFLRMELQNMSTKLATTASHVHEAEGEKKVGDMCV